MRRLPVAGMVLLALVLTCGGCGGGGGSPADALSDRLTDALDFDNGTVTEGAPPTGSSGSDAPQVATLDGPATLTLGQHFVVGLTTGYSQPEQVTRAIVSVGASPPRHIVVAAGLVEREGRREMLLAGRLAPDEQLRGHAFEVRIALQTAAGVTGLPGTWRLEIADADPLVIPGESIDEVAVEGEEWRESGRPEGSALTTAPQITRIEFTGQAIVDAPVPISIFSANTPALEVPDGTSGHAVAAIIVSTPNNPGYKITSDFTSRPVTRQGTGVVVDIRLMVTDPRLRGFTLLLLFALQNTVGETGLYYPLLIPVVAGTVDGDADGDADGDTADEVDEPDGDFDPEPELDFDGDTTDQSDQSDTEEIDGDTTQPDGDVDPEPDLDGNAVPLPAFVTIPAGTFVMGSQDGENCPPDISWCTIEEYPAEIGRGLYETQHYVTMTYDIEIGRYETTQQEFEARTGWNPSHFGPNGEGEDCGGDCPVEWVSWFDSLAYLNRLSIAAGLPACFVFSDVVCWDGTSAGTSYMECMSAARGGIDAATVTLAGMSRPQECEGYRLPTEAEWEFAARAGSRSPVYPSEGNDGTITALDCAFDANLDRIAWYCGNENTSTRPVGGKVPNAAGLHDMSGNVWEFVWDAWDYADYPLGSAVDPVGVPGGQYRAVRGGSWTNYAQFARSAYRYGIKQEGRGTNIGLRPARTVYRPLPSFVPVAAGTFVMGSPDGVNCPPDVPGCDIADYPAEVGRSSSERQHLVTLGYDFEIMPYELTQRQFAYFAGRNPSYFGPRENRIDCGLDCPVELVSWFEGLAYANWLSERQGFAPCYRLHGCSGTIGDGCDVWGDCSGTFFCSVVDLNGVAIPQECQGYRLPTEAEWEYAARAGSRTAYFNGELVQTGYGDDPFLDAIGWYAYNSDTGSGRMPHPVGGKLPNPWGLYDMNGNVHEWVWDWHQSAYESDTSNDPSGPKEGTVRGQRGGHWLSGKEACRSATRSGQMPFMHTQYLGLRFVRSPSPPEDGDVDQPVDGDAEIDGDAGPYVDLLCTNGVCLDPATGMEWEQELGTADWAGAVARCQNLDLNGTGWRLPNISELRSLVRNCPPISTDGECGAVDVCVPCGELAACLSSASSACYTFASCSASGICPNDGGPFRCYWPREFETRCGSLWSSSVDSSNSRKAWMLAFTGADVEPEYKDTYASSRCVRSENGPPEFCAGDFSSLRWQNPPAESAMPWTDAATYCANLDLDGGGWRLPSICELRSLIRGCPATELRGDCNIDDDWCLASSCRDKPACDGCPFMGGPAGGCYWSSELIGECAPYWSSLVSTDNTANAWVVSFPYGFVYFAPKDDPYYGRVRCVRTGQ